MCGEPRPNQAHAAPPITRVSHRRTVAETVRLILRHFHVEDSAAMDRVYGDPEVMKFSHGVRTLEWVRERLRSCLDDYHLHGFGLWAVVERTTHEVIGYCGLGHFQANGTQPEIELGYRLARPYWRRGFATEAARARALSAASLPTLTTLAPSRSR